MKILLIANYVPDAQQSMQRFASMLETGLTNFGHQVRVIRPEPWIGGFSTAKSSLVKWLGYIDKFILFPPQLLQAISWAEVVHICDHSNAIYTRYLKNIPHVVTCNDLLAIRSALGEIKENPTGWTGKQLQRMILNGLNRSQRVACISEQTKRDLMRLGTLPSSSVSVIYMGLNYAYTPMAAAEATQRLEALGIPYNLPFMLHVGGNQWYKNRLGVLSIFYYLTQKIEQPELSLLMVGKEWTPPMRQFIQERNLGHRVIELISVDNEDLRAIYSAATALLFPSLQEGFGWPIIEAQACGCPVFTSNRTPMIEVGGEAAIYIDPNHPEEAANTIAVSLTTLANLKPAGFLNVQRFMPEQMIESYVKLYQETWEQQDLRTASKYNVS